MSLPRSNALCYHKIPDARAQGYKIDHRLVLSRHAVNQPCLVEELTPCYFVRSACEHVQWSLNPLASVMLALQENLHCWKVFAASTKRTRSKLCSER